METIDLRKSFKNGDHISSKLLEPFYYGIDIPKEDSYMAIAGVLLLIDTISRLGGIEHTGDWDLCMNIVTRDGNQHSTGYGYGDCVDLKNPAGTIIPLKDLYWESPEDTDGWTLSFDSTNWPEDDDPDLESWNIPIHNILQISMDR